MKYQQFIPSINGSFTDSPDEGVSQDADDAMERQSERSSTATKKGASWHECDLFMSINLSPTSAVFTVIIHPGNKV